MAASDELTQQASQEGAAVRQGDSHRALLLAARELLIDIERTDLESLTAGQLKGPQATPAADGGGTSGGLDRKHKHVLLQQVDELRDGLLSEQQACEVLRQENEQLARDVRSLASQLKQERAASNAVLTRHQAGGGAAESSAGASVAEGSSGEPGLTLASAASQILLLRREVKFLQKRWNSARVDQDAATTREQMQQLREEAEEARKKAAGAEAATASIAAKSRVLVRELKAARAQVRAQQARMVRRSNAQREVASLKEQLAKAHDAFVAQQQTLKQLQLRERLRRATADDGDGEDGGEAGGGAGGVGEYDGAKLEAEVAHAGLGLLVLSQELTTLERAWMAEKGAAAELVAIKANMSFQVAQVRREGWRPLPPPTHTHATPLACACPPPLPTLPLASRPSQSKHPCAPLHAPTHTRPHAPLRLRVLIRPYAPPCAPMRLHAPLRPFTRAVGTCACTGRVRE